MKNERSDTSRRCAGVVAAACRQGKRTQHGKPHGVVSDDQSNAREGQVGRHGVAERFAVPLKLGNSGGEKEHHLKTDAIRREGPWRLGNLSTPKTVQKLQKALHAKAKAEAGYRFYALYDKISREDILAHAYAQCRSNKGAPGVDGQDFADIEAYGVQRWLGELALALRQETYRPDPIRRVFIPKANGKLRPLGISTVRDRVCMTAAMLVLEPIFEADLPPEQYAYRPGRNAQQAVIEVEGLLFRGHPEVVDADLADYFGSIPHAELLKSVARRIVDRRVLHLIKMWLGCGVGENHDPGKEDPHTPKPGQPAPHSPGFPHLHGSGEYIHAPVRAGMEEAQAGAAPRQSYRDLCRRSCDPVQERQCRRGVATTAQDHEQAEAQGQRGEDTNLQGPGRG